MVEATIVQLFIEVKWNQPSVIYIPSLIGWCAAITKTSQSTVHTILDALAQQIPPSYSQLLMDVSDLPRNVKAWFRPTKDNRAEHPIPTVSQHEAFFEGLMKDVQRLPNKFSDGMECRKPVLEEWPIVPPLEPHKPIVAELSLQEDRDTKTLVLLKHCLGLILTELKKKFKTVCEVCIGMCIFIPLPSLVFDWSLFHHLEEEDNFWFPRWCSKRVGHHDNAAFETHPQQNGIIDITGDQSQWPDEWHHGTTTDDATGTSII